MGLETPVLLPKSTQGLATELGFKTGSGTPESLGQSSRRLPAKAAGACSSKPLFPGSVPHQAGEKAAGTQTQPWPWGERGLEQDLRRSQPQGREVVGLQKILGVL